MLNKHTSIIAFLISIVFTMSANAAESNEIEPYIINGLDTNTSEYPSYVHLYVYKGLGDNSNYGLCGASILDAYHVLTAAHCVDPLEIEEETLLFTAVVPNLDSVNDIDSADIHYISEIYIHDNYDSILLLNDIAVIKLEKPLNVASNAYIKLATDRNAYRDLTENFVAVGYGLIDQDLNITASVLQKTTLEYVENASCNYYTGGAPDTQLCMKGEVQNNHQNAICSGDSGGPLYWTSGSVTYQVGTTSYGSSIGCGTTDPTINATSVFTEVIHFESWIENVKNGLEKADYRINNNDRINKDEHSSGGGGTPLWSVFLLLGICIFRKYKA